MPERAAGGEPGYERDAFLSHAAADEEVARAVFGDLEAGQLAIWFDEAEITPGDSIPAKINWGLEHSRLLIVLMTASYFDSASGWTDAEWHSALHLDPDNRRGRIIPALAGDCPYVPPLLRQLSRVDLRGKRYAQGMRELLAVIRGDRLARTTMLRGQLITVGGFIDRATLFAERSLAEADPDAITERLYCNLLPVEHLPRWVYSAPIAAHLRHAREDGTEALPTKEQVKLAINEAQRAAGATVFSPAFRLDGERVLSFHELEEADGPFAPVVQRERAERFSTADLLADDDERRLVISLCNMALSRHAYRRGLVSDHGTIARFYFPPKDGGAHVITWRPFSNTSPRTVAKPCARDGHVRFWIHQGAYLQIVFLANKLYLKVRPTWVLTDDGVSVKTGPKVGALVGRWTSAERNVHLLYHLRFWSSWLRERLGPISMRAGDQHLDIGTAPASIELPFGIVADTKDLERRLDVEAPLIAEREATLAEAAAAIEADEEEDDEVDPLDDADEEDTDAD
ncbi:MAG: toll/interleukin-1 receptor domain-containing protein [Candidatus Limnocylindria bacterium]